jgi:hypothetical protein
VERGQVVQWNHILRMTPNYCMVFEVFCERCFDLASLSPRFFKDNIREFNRNKQENKNQFKSIFDEILLIYWKKIINFIFKFSHDFK